MIFTRAILKILILREMGPFANPITYAILNRPHIIYYTVICRYLVERDCDKLLGSSLCKVLNSVYMYVQASIL